MSAAPLRTTYVLSGGAAKGIVDALQIVFETECGATIEARFGAVGAMKEKLLAGDPCDIAILTAALIDELAASGRVDAASGAPLGHVATGLAVPTGQPVPTVADGPSLAAALRAASAVYLPDPQRATAGIHFVDVLTRLGIREEVEGRLRPFPNGAAAMAQMARDHLPGAIGCTQVTEIRYTDGVTWVAPLPEGYGLETVYVAAVTARSADPALAAKLVALLTGPGSLDIRAAGGFDV